MKTRLLLILIFSVLTVHSLIIAQAPNGFNYQAVLYDAAGNARVNANVSIEISILQGSATGVAVYTETHNATTNKYGAVSFEVGSKDIASFSGIDWATGPYFIKITVDGTLMGVSQLLSVPYAKYADKAGNGFSGNYNDLLNKPLLFSGDYNDLTNKPAIFTGNYLDLINKPTVFSGNYNDLTGKPSLFSGSYNDLTDKPVLFSGSYVDLTNKPTLFSGNYNDLTGKPDLTQYLKSSNTAKWDKDSTDNVILTGNQTISGNKNFTDTIKANKIIAAKDGVNSYNKNIINVASPVNNGDAVNKAYVDGLKNEIDMLSNSLLEAGFNGIVTDNEGNSYKTKKIGTQIWMVENLRTKHYNTGEVIPTTSGNISSETNPKYQWAFNENESNVPTYGRLYTWHVVTDSRKICPAGWHVASYADWDAIATYAGGAGVAGNKMKEAGTTHWVSPNTSDNSTGFTGLPGSYRVAGGFFAAMGETGNWWTSDQASTGNGYMRYMIHDGAELLNYQTYKYYGLSVRCVKD